MNLIKTNLCCRSWVCVRKTWFVSSFSQAAFGSSMLFDQFGWVFIYLISQVIDRTHVRLCGSQSTHTHSPWINKKGIHLDTSRTFCRSHSFALGVEECRLRSRYRTTINLLSGTFLIRSIVCETLVERANNKTFAHTARIEWKINGSIRSAEDVVPAFYWIEILLFLCALRVMVHGSVDHEKSLSQLVRVS